MALESRNPANGELTARFDYWDDDALEEALARAASAGAGWRRLTLEARCTLLRRVAGRLRAHAEELAGLITLEMGKLIGEARGEIEKCAWVCEHYAEHAAQLLADETIASDARRSYVAYQPLGAVLAVMPWNFPFWQVFRFAAPALAAGNTALLKHASNVPQCARAIEALFRDAGAPPGVFVNLPIAASTVEKVIRDHRVQAVTLTGSEAAGRRVAAVAGECLKKSVLELGGSDPFIVLADAELERAVGGALTSRFLNCGQSCIAAKRFIVEEGIAERFVAGLQRAVEALRPGDPRDPATTLAPMARADLVDAAHAQVRDALAHGATAVTGCRPLPGPGCFYAPSILDHVTAEMRVWSEELFAPVALVIRVRNSEEAVHVANASPFGLGGSVWSGDAGRAEALALELECGCAFVNGMVKSDPRLPFGGIKASGYGRELGRLGLHEFLNAKSVWIG